MKILAFVFFIATLTIQCYAQQAQQADKMFLVQKSERYRRMHNTGSLLAITGGVLFIGGFVTLLNSTTTTTYNGGSYQTSSTGNPEGGAAAFLIGAAGLGAGIPLWIIGAHSQHKYERKLETLYVGFNVNPRQAGLTFTIKL